MAWKAEHRFSEGIIEKEERDLVKNQISLDLKRLRLKNQILPRFRVMNFQGFYSCNDDAMVKRVWDSDRGAYRAKENGLGAAQQIFLEDLMPDVPSQYRLQQFMRRKPSLSGKPALCA